MSRVVRLGAFFRSFAVDDSQTGEDQKGKKEAAINDQNSTRLPLLPPIRS